MKTAALKRRWLSLLIPAFALLANVAQAQTYNWVKLTAGSPGITNDGTTKKLDWSWNPGNVSIDGKVDITRSGAGQHYILAENQHASIIASGRLAGPYDGSPVATNYGGVDGIFQFGSEGQFPRGPRDVNDFNPSTSTIDFSFSAGLQSPSNTIISLFDPGYSYQANVVNYINISYSITAYLKGARVDTSSWTLQLVDPYLPSSVNSSAYSWNASTATLTQSQYQIGSGHNFPDTLAFLNTQGTVFDRLVLTAHSVAIDAFAVGIGAATPPTLPLSLTTSWVNGANSDKVSLTLGGAGVENAKPGSSSGSSTADVPASGYGLGGKTVTIAENIDAGSASSYNVAWQCRKISNGSLVASGNGTTGSFTMPDNSGVNCTFTNTSSAVTGRVFLDNGVASGVANDGIFNGGEAPLSGVTVRLTDCAATVHSSALTDATGHYRLAVPLSVAKGAALCVEQVNNPDTRVSTGASVGNTALPSGSALAVAGDTYTYIRPGTHDHIAFSWNGSGHADLNFGDVDNSSFAASGAKTGLPGSTVTYPHIFTAGTGGRVRFSVAGETATPPLAGWTTEIFADTGCTGSLQPGAARLYPAAIADTGTSVAFAGKTCVIVKHFIPATAPMGASNKTTVKADFDLVNAAPSLSASFVLDDVTTVSTVALELKKEVRNVTQGATVFGVNNQAKSGETLEYRITYTNNSDAPIRSMTVSDLTPGHTSFVSATTGTTPATLTACTKSTPANAPPKPAVACTQAQSAGGMGTIEWIFAGSIAPGDTGAVLFQVKLD